MAKFFVGQRVRMIATDNEKANSCVGQETRIIAESVWDCGESWDLENGWSVMKFCAGEFISPILPDGNREGMPRVCKTLDDLVERLQEVAA